MPVIRYQQINAHSRLVNESHPKAKLSDAQVAEMRDMHERVGVSMRCIAKTFDVPRRTVRAILNYEVRNQVPSRIIPYKRPK